MIAIVNSLEQVLARIKRAADSSGRRAESVQLVAVSKRQPPVAIAEAWQAGQRDFGENYLQEALDKIQALSLPAIRWHFIGPIQSNKTRDIAQHFAWVHTVDRLKIARRLSEQRDPGLPPLQICIQVNISDEASKSGVAPSEAVDLCVAVANLPRLQLRGLMALPENSNDKNIQRTAFRALRELRDDIAAAHGLELDTLSMGMSADMEVAIGEGATIVRVGTDIFGPRPT